MSVKQSPPRDSEAAHTTIVYRRKDLRIPNTTPEQSADK